MNLQYAFWLAFFEGRSHVYRVKYPGIHRGIRTEFTKEEQEATDWQVSKI